MFKHIFSTLKTDKYWSAILRNVYIFNQTKKVNVLKIFIKRKKRMLLRWTEIFDKVDVQELFKNIFSTLSIDKSWSGTHQRFCN